MSATFVAPQDLDRVLQALADGAVTLAGGTDLVVGHRQGKRPLPDAVVSIDRVGELRGISGDDALIIGSTTTHDAVIRDERVRARFTALADACAIVGSEATRSTGTIGGNLMNASPAADTIGPLLCLGGVAVLRSVGGERRVAIGGDLLVGPGRTTATSGELLTSIEIPPLPPRSASAYVRLEYRRQMEIAVVGATAVITLDEDGVIVDARIAITALAPTIHRVAEAEACLMGQLPSRSAADAAGAIAAESSSPISDVRGSADYRRAMAAVITRRAILAAATRAGGEQVNIPASDSTFGAWS